MTIALAGKKTPLVMKALQLEPEPYARAQLQVMRRNIATRRRKKSDGGEIRRRLWNGNRNKNLSLWAIDNRIADIEPRGHSPCRIELDNPADIHRKSGVGFTEFDRIANNTKHPRRAKAGPETGFGVDKTGPNFAKYPKSIKAQAALYSELALETANVIETGGRKVIQLAFERQVFRQIECQPASSSDVRCDAAGPSSYHGKLSAHF
jgi:hypothetical protein